MIIIKVNGDIPNSKDDLKKRVHRAWKMNMDRLYNQKELAAVCRGEILEVYRVLSYHKDEEHTDRVAFELEETDSPLKGKKIQYPTSNPATIVDPTKIQFIS